MGERVTLQMNDMWSRRLSEVMAPTDSELAALEEAKLGRHRLKRNAVLCRQDQSVNEVYFVVDGWVAASVEVNGGKRQLVKIYLPGDFAGLPSIATMQSVEGLIALTDACVDVIPLDRLAKLFERAPRLGYMLFVVTQQERVMLMDQLAAVGQTRGIQRVAALIIHLHRRLSILSGKTMAVIDWPLSQQRVAEGAGLTNIHVNRIFRDLTSMGLICREGRKIKILDVDRLAQLAALPERPTRR